MCEIDSVAASQNLPSSSDDVTALETEPSSSWLPESQSIETVSSDSVPKAVPPSKVEAVTLIMTVHPGTPLLP